MNSGYCYLLDTVTIKKLPLRILESGFVKTYAKVPEEILYELTSTPRFSKVKHLRLEAKAGVLNCIHSVFDKMNQSNSVIDLYKNEGNGDVILLAMALHGRNLNAGMLIGKEWAIVTDDIGLKNMAGSLKIKIFTTNEFSRLVTQG